MGLGFSVGTWILVKVEVRSRIINQNKVLGLGSLGVRVDLLGSISSVGLRLTIEAYVLGALSRLGQG